MAEADRNPPEHIRSRDEDKDHPEDPAKIGAISVLRKLANHLGHWGAAERKWGGLPSCFKSLQFRSLEGAWGSIASLRVFGLWELQRMAHCGMRAGSSDSPIPNHNRRQSTFARRFQVFPDTI